MEILMKALEKARLTMERYRRAGLGDDVFHADLCDAIKAVDAALVASPPPLGEVEALAEFGLGNLGVDTGTAHGKPAVFIRPLDHFGPVGDKLPDAKQIKGPQPSLEPGEFYLTFPTMEQAEQVAAALSDASATADGWRLVPYLWQCKDYADGWLSYANEDEAQAYQRDTGCAVRITYLPLPAAPTATGGR